MTWTLYARDAAGVRRAEIDDYGEAIAVPRFNDIGKWELTLPSDALAVATLAEPQSGVEFVRDGVTILSGPVTSSERTSDENADTLRLSGVDDLVWLAWRQAHPQPGSPAPSGTPPTYSVTAQDVHTGASSTVMRALVDVNAGPSAISNRRVAGLTLAADPAIGVATTIRARWQAVLIWEQYLGKVAGLGFRMPGLAFEVYQPVDRSGSVVFSRELGNLSAFTYRSEAPEANYAFVAGGGVGTARTIVEVEDTSSSAAWGRIETFRDQRDLTVVAELQAAGIDELAQKSTRYGISLTPIDLPGRVYGVDYGVGDIVTVLVDGAPITDVVTEARIVLNPDGDQITPGVGNPEALKPTRLFSRLADLARRTTDLERI